MHLRNRALLAIAGGAIASAGHCSNEVLPGAADGATLLGPAGWAQAAAPPPASVGALRPASVAGPWRQATDGPASPPYGRTATVIAVGFAGLAVYGATQWWQDGLTGRFRSVDEQWFSRVTDHGGADKLGHAFSTYAGTRGLTWAFQGLGHDPGTARRLGFATTLAAFTAVEVADGFSRKHRFSKEDMVMNTVGATLGYVMERFPAVDELIDYRLLYRRSTIAGQRSRWDPAGDYSGQTYLLAFKASGVPALRERSVIRYLELAVGYRARGYEGRDDRLIDPDRRRRDVYVGVSLNLSRLLNDTVFAHRQGTWDQRITSGVLEFVQVPGTVALRGERL
jgi:hypothetical protein